MSEKLKIMALCFSLFLVASAVAQRSFAADVETVGNLKVQGWIESTSGGFRFPDGSELRAASMDDGLIFNHGFVVDNAGLNIGNLDSGAIKFGAGDGSTGEGIASTRQAGPNQNGLDFYTNSTSRLAITNSGFVGIGTRAPAFPLTEAAVNGQWTRAQFGYRYPLYLMEFPPAIGFNVYAPGGGVVTYGSTHPAGFLTFDWNTPGGFEFKTAPSAAAGTSIVMSTRMAITNDGKVGIGTSTPGERLEVSGTVKATMFSGSGSALTNLNAGSVTGTLAVTQGGTGATDGAAALVNLGAAPVAHNHDTTYQKIYGKVAVVARSGGDYAEPVAAMNSLATWCGTPSVTNPCLLKIMPGVYDIGANSLTMVSYVDMEGSGEGTTRITGSIDNYDSGVVNGASNAEIVSLTIENAGSVGPSIAIYNGNASPTITNVTAIAKANADSMAIKNRYSSPTISNVSIITSLSGTGYCYGIYNDHSSPSITNTSVTTGSTCNGYGIYNISSSSPVITNLSATLYGTFTSIGVHNEGGGTVSLKDSTIYARENPNDQVYPLGNKLPGKIYVDNSYIEGHIYNWQYGAPYAGIVYGGTRTSKGEYWISGSTTVQAGSNSAVGLIVKEFPGQTTNLQEWRQGDDLLYASMSNRGVLSLPPDGLSVGWDREHSIGQFVIVDGKAGIGTVTPTETLDIMGNTRINDMDIFFRGGTDKLHGLGFYGGSKTFAGIDVNGPVLYGNGGGALGTVNGATQRIALSWNVANNVSVEGDLSAQGDLTVNSIPTGSTSYVLCSSAANRGVIQRCSASSRKLKENIADLALGLDTVNKLRPVSFTWKENGNEDIGFIAEEVAALKPVLAIYNEQGEPDGVKYANMSAVLVKAIQEQQAIIELQKEDIRAQKEKIKTLEDRLSRLEVLIN